MKRRPDYPTEGDVIVLQSFAIVIQQVDFGKMEAKVKLVPDEKEAIEYLASLGIKLKGLK